MSTLPDFNKDVTGQCYGGAYYSEADYRITITTPDDGENFVLHVEDTIGTVVIEEVFGGDVAEQIRDLAHTSEEQDDIGRMMITREIHWHLRSAVHHVDLDMNVIEEIGAWFEFALGDEEWEGGDSWEY